MIAIDIAALVQTALDDRQRCRVAGIAPSSNTEMAAHVVGLANRLRDRLGPGAAMRIAFTFWDSLTPQGGQVH
jgi:hypothetical protein